MSNIDKIRIKDIMSKTGFSRSTIDRVLNNREGVRARTKERVEAVLNELGYAANALDDLRKRSAPNTEVFLSEGTNPFFEQLWIGMRTALDEVLTGQNISFKGFDPYEPKTLLALLRGVREDTKCVITVGVETASVASAIDELVARGVRVVTTVSDVPMSHRAVFVGQNNFAAGKTAGRLMLEMTGSTPGSLAVMTGHLEFRHLLERRAGFEQMIGLTDPTRRVYFAEPFGGRNQPARDIFHKTLKQLPDLVGVYFCGGGQPGLFDALGETDLKSIAHEMTPSSRAALLDGSLNFAICHDILDLSRKTFSAAMNPNISHGTVPCGIHIHTSENLPQENLTSNNNLVSRGGVRPG